MSDISELEGRITAALDRIGAGLEALGPSGASAEAEEEIAALKSALEEEKTANAQLEERVRAIKEKQESTVSTLATEVERLRKLLEDAEGGLEKLRKINTSLRSNNVALREAMSNGVAEPHLVNKAMMAELEALRAAQAADRAELDAVLGELEPLIAAADPGETQTEETGHA